MPSPSDVWGSERLLLICIGLEALYECKFSENMLGVPSHVNLLDGAFGDILGWFDWTAFFLENAETEEHCVVVILLVIHCVVHHLIDVHIVVVDCDVMFYYIPLLLQQQRLADDEVVQILHAESEPDVILRCVLQTFHLDLRLGLTSTATTTVLSTTFEMEPRYVHAAPVLLRLRLLLLRVDRCS